MVTFGKDASISYLLLLLGKMTLRTGNRWMV